MPELLDPTGPATLAKQTTREFWITVHVPGDAPPGTYTGSVILSDRKGIGARLQVEVRVLPFRLRGNERPVGMYWYEQKVVGSPRLESQIRDMLAHGVTMVTLGGIFPDIHTVDGSVRLETGVFEQLLIDLHSLGVRGPIPYHISSLMTNLKRAFPGKPPEEYDALYVESVRQLELISADPDTPELLYYPVDEVGNHEERGEKANHECALIGRVP